ncbi:TnsA endonuclease N-terminal domain-containing protein [Phenylobacterium sp.]|uniref:TnsA endonuclease N-terminal domain-containing protein n=1 Tax=Phenylobacterium sp. TaxID=1871053 RepID=UPI00289869BA|nr:TnsA endonuclease N-terminal domain-containing protein [Phenylobacterium sp.]
MNTHTTNHSQRSRPAPIDERRSPAPSLLDAILSPLAKPAKHSESGTFLTAATVVLTPDGSPIRSVLTGRRIMVTGFYTSRKAGCAMPYEGMNELALLKHCEVDTSVIDYRSQPFRFEFVIDGVKRTYIADCTRLMDDGTIEVLEAKASSKYLRDPKYAEKLKAVESTCNKLGWRFRAVTRNHLFEPRPVFANVDLIQSRRFVRIDEADAYRTVEFIEGEGGETTLGRLSEVLGRGPGGFAIAQAMMVRRLITLDLRAPLSAMSLVTLVNGRPAKRRATR